MTVVENKTEMSEWQYDMATGTYTLIYESGWIHISIEVYRRAGDEQPGMAWAFRSLGAITTYGNLDVPCGATAEQAKDAALVKVVELLKLKIAHYQKIVNGLEGE